MSNIRIKITVERCNWLEFLETAGMLPSYESCSVLRYAGRNLWREYLKTFLATLQAKRLYSGLEAYYLSAGPVCDTA
jgi:hypothetical protein